MEAAGVGELFGFAAGMEGKAVRGGDKSGSLPTAGTIPTIPPLAAAVDRDDDCTACAIDVEFWFEVARLDPGTGSVSNAVSGGDESGLLPTAGTIPTMPDDTAGAAVFAEELAVTAAAVFVGPDFEVVEAVTCGFSCDAAIVAKGCPLGSTNVTLPVGVAAFLCPPL